MSTNPFSDDYSQPTQQPPSQLPPQMGPPSSARPALPVWAWVFIIACVGVPVMTLGGAIPVVLAVIAISAITSLARNPQIPLAIRVGGCVVITGAAYGAMVFLIVMFASLK